MAAFESDELGYWGYSISHSTNLVAERLLLVAHHRQNALRLPRHSPPYRGYSPIRDLLPTGWAIQKARRRNVGASHHRGWQVHC